MELYCPACGLLSLGDAGRTERLRCPKCGGSLTDPSGGSLTLLQRTGAETHACVARIQLPAHFRARFEVQRLLGAGAMGSVWRAFDRELGRPVAIKCLQRQDDPDLVDRLEREGRAMARVAHPNVVALYDVLVIEGYPVLIAEYLDGGTLRERLRKHGKLRAMESVRVATECLAGLAACHGHGFVHRDIKPENVLFDELGCARVADLGLVSDVQDTRGLTRTGGLMGTPYYMAPEQLRGEGAGPASDLYAVGVVLYEMLSGHRPFTGDNLPELFENVLHAHPLPLIGVPGRLGTIVLRALSKDPRERPSSAESLASALASSLRTRSGGLAVATTSSTDVLLVPGQSSARRAVRIAGSMVATLMAGTVLFAVFRSDRAARAPGVQASTVPRLAEPSVANADPLLSEVGDVFATEGIYNHDAGLLLRSLDVHAAGGANKVAAFRGQGAVLEGKLARLGERLAGREGRPASPRSAVLLSATGVRRLRVEVRREQIAQLHAAVQSRAVPGLLRLLRADPARLSRLIQSAMAAVDGVIASADPGLDDSLAPFNALESVRATAWVIADHFWLTREQSRQLEQSFAAALGRLTARLPGNRGVALSAATDAAWRLGQLPQKDTRRPPLLQAYLAALGALEGARPPLPSCLAAMTIAERRAIEVATRPADAVRAPGPSVGVAEYRVLSEQIARCAKALDEDWAKFEGELFKGVEIRENPNMRLLCRNLLVKHAGLYDELARRLESASSTCEHLSELPEQELELREGALAQLVGHWNMVAACRGQLEPNRGWQPHMPPLESDVKAALHALPDLASFGARVEAHLDVTLEALRRLSESGMPSRNRLAAILEDIRDAGQSTVWYQGEEMKRMNFHTALQRWQDALAQLPGARGEVLGRLAAGCWRWGAEGTMRTAQREALRSTRKELLMEASTWPGDAAAVEDLARRMERDAERSPRASPSPR